MFVCNVPVTATRTAGFFGCVYSFTRPTIKAQIMRGTPNSKLQSLDDGSWCKGSVQRKFDHRWGYAYPHRIDRGGRSIAHPCLFPSNRIESYALRLQPEVPISYQRKDQEDTPERTGFVALRTTPPSRQTVQKETRRIATLRIRCGVHMQHITRALQAERPNDVEIELTVRCDTPRQALHFR